MVLPVLCYFKVCLCLFFSSQYIYLLTRDIAGTGTRRALQGTNYTLYRASFPHNTTLTSRFARVVERESLVPRYDFPFE